MEDKVVSIFKKNIPKRDTILIKTNAIITVFAKEDIFESISNISIRREWDTIFSEFKIVDSNEKEGWEILYISIKVSIVDLVL